MRELFELPDVGEGLTEAEISEWKVAPGDTVTVNQVLVEIETAKAAVELPSPYAGTVGELLVEAGTTVQVGAPIIAIETAGDPAPSTAAAGSAAVSSDNGAKIGEAGADGRIATLVGYGPRQGTATRRPRRGSGPSAPGEMTPVVPREPAERDDRHLTGEPSGRDPVPAASGRGAVPLAPPPVRKFARDAGVDLRTVTGSGPGGRITRADVEAAASAPPAPPAAAPPAGGRAAPAVAGAAAVAGAGAVGAAAAPRPATRAPSGGDRREPIRGVRKATAEAMVSSAFTAPHVTEFLAVDVTETMELRDRLRASRGFDGVKLTPLAFVAKAVCLAAARTPEVNARWDADAGEIVYFERVQLGIAAATPRGLMVPKIRDADLLGLRDVAVALDALTTTARDGKTPPADLVGGTITITNVGVFGVDTGTPILNPGEAAILAVGSIKQAPWVVDGELAVRTVCQLALSFDHRLVDGEQGSRFLADVGALLADPGIAFTW
ncbi:dihydrolipoamide acetyltransferase family protein [Pseudonocardia endophytica]|uniref:Dihydrolipoamide acetyltransferase component of pyruvate dehydrogenase complex n=1 Tax=Pseudonocardia endophytica TaxID=401976 RepID=A0A4R1I1D3_PSEEN|nr:dihydrolipoamide acetyltransferase family protein [Pseudonocardia endophytica]TCK27741.1 pyruvate dehydrogenase E2 component (dihydrolipoamide acetyltransferase) [Pseudonocardia endophytica]